MKRLISLVTALTFISISAYANEIDCVISYNLEPVSQVTVTTNIGQKVLIDQFDGMSTYITQKDETFYSLETFLAGYDMRGYSEGMLTKVSDKLIFSLWTRENLTEIACTLAKK